MTKHATIRTVLAAAVVLAFAAAASGQIPKKDFYGTWKMSHDGWDGTLVLRGSGTATGIFGDYVGADGKVHFVQGTAEDRKAVLWIDLKDTRGLPEDDQNFEGYLFTQTRAAIAGTTKWGSQVYGWYAVKTSAATNLPPAPVVSMDKPDPAGADPEEIAVVVGSSGEFRLSTTKPEYAVGEPCRFELSSTLVKDVDLSGYYYVIERREGDKPVEFYTSPKEPFAGTTLHTGDKRLWVWDLWDNERQNKAQAGNWRIKFFAPNALTKPFIVRFKIKAPS